MTKRRQQIPKATRDAVLKEFNHRCAFCGADRPHLHHIDENPANGDPLNLIPLCPNHHLVDQHDATNKTPQAKLSFFRRHKHRHILKPQFNPIFRRMAFFDAITDADTVAILESRAAELVNLIRNLAMGQFYAEELVKLLKTPSVEYIKEIGGSPEAEARSRESLRERERKYRDQLRQNRQNVEHLIVEMLDYQVWPDEEKEKR